ncbi:unnamed protein product [Adineta ricciae]|uniref:Uncharacterized protein n=1 Tax=Adineta ricciae TaxID=249248 RepID=A0A814E2Q3_ADIRI|nr:unnamed protein product [Adineta ricciae]CAF1138745.1 unnamed protein product [Adineta ricciae]
MTIDLSQCKQTSDLDFNYPLFSSYLLSSTTRTPSRQYKTRHRKQLRSKRKKCAECQFRYRNTITVRQISSQDMIDVQRLDKTRCLAKPSNPPHKRRKDETHPLAKVQMSSRQSMNGILPDELSTIKNKDKMSNKMNTTNLKVIPLCDLSNVSLESNKLHVVSDDNNQSKENIVHSATKLVSDNASRQLTPTNSSIVPHFSSTIAPRIPLQTSLSSIIVQEVLAKESNTPLQLRSLHDNIHELVEQLKACVATLNLLIESEEKRKKTIRRRNRAKKRRLNSPANLRRQAKPLANIEPYDENLCIPSVYHNQHEELQRCLLIYNCSEVDRHRYGHVHTLNNVE